MTAAGGTDFYAFQGSRAGAFLRRCVRAAADEVEAQRVRVILWAPFFIALGDGLYFSLLSEPPAFLGFGGLAVCVAGLVAAFPLRRAGVAGYAGWLALGALCLFLLGFCAAQVRTMSVHAPVLERRIGAAEVQGRVVALEKLEDGDGYRMLLDRLSIERLPAEKTPERVRLKIPGKDAAAGMDRIGIGDTVRVLAGLNPPAPPAAPGAFDFQLYSYFQRIGGYGFVFNAPEIVERGRPSALSQRLEALRQALRMRVERAVPYPQAGVAVALTTGERAGIAEEDWDALRAAGLAHMLAISGLHVGLAAGIVFGACRFLMALFPWFALRYPVKKIAAVAGFAAALCYTLVTGAAVPALRALLMTGIVFLAVLTDRVALSLRLVALAACVVLLCMPEALTGASFQMSFSAVAALVFWYEAMRPHMTRWYKGAGFVRRGALYFLGICMTSLVATVATAPFSLFHFQQLALYGIVANLFAIPVLAFVVMPAAVASCLLMAVGLEWLSLPVMDAGVRVILAVAHEVQALPFSTWTPPAATVPVLVLTTIAGYVAVAWKGRGRLAALIPVAVAVAVLAAYQPPDILVSSSGKLAGWRDEDGKLWVSGRQADRFTAQVWARRGGEAPEDLENWRRHPGFACDPEGCRVTRDGKHVAFSFQQAGQEADCAWADILVSFEPVRVRDCHAPVRVDFFDLRRDGAYEIRLDGRAVSVRQMRGERPWTGVSYR